MKRSSIRKWMCNFNPLMSVPAKLFDLAMFHFWHPHLWPQLASSTLNLCRKKRSFQSYPDLTIYTWKYTRKCSEIWVKNSEQNVLWLHLCVANSMVIRSLSCQIFSAVHGMCFGLHPYWQPRSPFWQIVFSSSTETTVETDK